MAIANTTGRQCGKCSLCCYMLPVAELKKPEYKWCEHCRPGNGGCSIYNNRPAEVCGSFRCEWLRGAMPLSEEWYPPRSKMIVRWTTKGLEFNVHPEFQTAWQKQPYLDQIRAWGRLGAARAFPVFVLLRNEVVFFLPNGEMRRPRDVSDEEAAALKADFGRLWSSAPLRVQEKPSAR
jgi:hypothetical protein